MEAKTQQGRMLKGLDNKRAQYSYPERKAMVRGMLILFQLLSM